MRSVLLLAIFTGLLFAGNGQIPFVKAITTNMYNPAVDIAVINSNRYACITENNFYLLNNKGETINSTTIQTAPYSYLNAVGVDSKEQVRILNHVLDDASRQSLELFTFNKDGQQTGKKVVIPLSNESYEKFQLIPSVNNSFYIVNKHYINGEVHLDIRFLNEQLDEQWRTELADTVYFNYGATILSNGDLSIAYQRKDTRAAVLTTITPQGGIHQITTAITAVIMNHTPTIDGGYLFCGHENGNALLVKTYATGQEVWRRTIDIYKDDMFMVVKSVPDGYVALGLAGLSNKNPDQTEADIVLFKTDLQGNKLWLKAFGAGSSDNAKQLRVLADERLLLLASSSLPGATTSPLLISTDKNGNTDQSLPFTLQPAAEMALLETGKDAKIERTIRTTYASGNFINGLQSMTTGQTDLFAGVGLYSQQGALLSKKILSAYPSSLKALKPTRDGHFMAVVQFSQSFFGNQFYLIKLNAQGDSVWRKETGVNGQIFDVLATTDGGYLFTGTADMTFINYDLYLMKTDANGNVLWTKTIGIKDEWESGRSIIETQEHDYVIAGNTQKAFDQQSSVYVIKIDNNGNTKWSTAFKAGFTIDVAVHIIHSTDNHYILTGYATPQGIDNRDVVVMKLNPQGNLVWKKTYDLHKKDGGVVIRNTAGDGYVVACTAGDPNYGVLESFAALLKLNNEGTKEWVKYYGVPGKQTTIAGMMQTDDQTILLTGTTQKEYGMEEQFMVRANMQAPAEEPIGETGISVYPNPVRSSTKLVVTHNETGHIKWRITDAAGKIVEAGHSLKTGARFEKIIVLNKYAAGVYELRAWLNEQVFTKRLLVVHQ